MPSRIDTLVLGAGLRGLAAALRTLRESPTANVLVVDEAPRPGGAVRTQRSNGFSCELGPFAFDRDAIAPTLSLLTNAPRTVDAATTTGHVFSGNGLVATSVDPIPVSFASGAEELPQACRRDLGSRLLLGRAATAITHRDDAFCVTLGGESPTTLDATRLVMALPLQTTARLLATFDRVLGDLAERLRSASGAFVFFGGDASAARERQGYGIVAAADVDSPLREVIHCDLVFAGRALPGRFLTRCELVGAPPDASDDALLTTAANELRRWTGTRAAFPFTKVHRFVDETNDATAVECRVRLRAIAAGFADLILP